jgi:allantoinase
VDLVLRSSRVVLPGGIGPASVHVQGGVIRKVDAFDAIGGAPLEDVGDRVIMAGLVDTHVHVNEPGRTEWEGFATATRAAAAGGVTTIVDMPLNASPPTTTLRAFEAKVAAMEGKLQVDVGLTGGVVPGNEGELRALVSAGVLAFKCFLVDSGIEDFAWSPRDVLERALPALSAADVPLLVHAELAGPIDEAMRRQGNLSDAELRKYVAWLESRPKASENEAVDLVIDLTRKTGARAHVVHLSSADAIGSLRASRDAGVRVSAETCPHYLSLAAEDVPDGATAFKCAPPIRERENRVRLWQALRDEVIAQVVTDHSPAPGALKCTDSGDFVRAWGGIASLELGLSVVWTEARARGFRVEHIAEWMCAAPARLVGLDGRKGRIAAGLDADLVVWEPDGERVVDVKHLQQRHPITPYDERRLKGVVRATYLRGRKVFGGGTVVGEAAGRLVKRAGIA